MHEFIILVICGQGPPVHPMKGCQSGPTHGQVLFLPPPLSRLLPTIAHKGLYHELGLNKTRLNQSVGW